MKKVYVVTRGYYSDYGITGIFTSKELAQMFIDSFKSNTYDEFNDIETWTLNPFEINIKEGHKPYFLYMDREGNASGIEIEDNPPQFTHDRKQMYFHIFAINKEHAVKIANEKRIQILASNKWPVKK